LKKQKCGGIFFLVKLAESQIETPNQAIKYTYCCIAAFAAYGCPVQL